MKLNIADVNIEFNSWYKDFFENVFKDYRVEDFPKADFRLDSIIHNGIEMPEGDPINNALKGDVRELIFELDDENNCNVEVDLNGQIISKCTYSKDFSKMRIEINEAYKGISKSLEQIEFLYSSYAFANYMAYNNALILKADLIDIGEKCVALASRQNSYERTVLRLINGEIVAYNTPWSREKNQKNRKIVNAFVFLEGGEQNHFRKVSTIESIYYLSVSSFRPNFQADLSNKNMFEIESIIKEFPIYMLSCDDFERSKALCKEFF